MFAVYRKVAVGVPSCALTQRQVADLATLLKTWFMIAVLQARPEHLPGDRNSFKLAVLVAIATNVLASLVLASGQNLILQASVDLVLASTCLYFALNLAGLSERFLQTFSAYCGVTAVFNMAYIVVGVVLPPRSDGVEPGLASLFLEYLFLVWSVAALAHIIKHALNLNTGLSVLAAVGYFFTYILTIQMLIGL